MGTRITKEVLYLRRDFTKDEKLEMGSKLAESYNLMSDIEEEESIMKSQIKERKSQVEATIGTVSRNLANGYAMENVDCELVYDFPNVGEVTYKRMDDGVIAKTRAMTGAENQQELEFKASDFVNAADSLITIESFFGDGTVDAVTAAPEPDPEAVFSDPTPGANLEAIKPEHDAAFEGTVEKPRRGRPKGSTNKAETQDTEPF